MHHNAEAAGVKLDQKTLGAIDDAHYDVAVTEPRHANIVKEAGRCLRARLSPVG